jgi:adenosylcobyric acid synthase
MKERVEKPCLGVVPYLSSLMLDEEDSLGLRFTTQSHWTAEEVLNQLTDANL